MLLQSPLNLAIHISRLIHQNVSVQVNTAWRPAMEDVVPEGNARGDYKAEVDI